MAASVRFSDIPELNENNVFIQNKTDLERKIRKIKSDGVSKLPIITDFDFTLTRNVKDDGMAVPTNYVKMAASVRFSDIPELNENNVFIQNKPDLERKIRKIKSDGVGNLQIITDFDFTLTRNVKDDGTAVPTTYDMFTNCPSVPVTNAENNRELANTYRPYEMNPRLTIEEEEVYMNEWYTAVNNALRGIMMPWQELKVEAQTLIRWFRTGVRDMITWTKEKHVPVLIFSAGMEECVRVVMNSSDLIPENLKIVANRCRLDENNVIVGIEGEIIHPVNKNATALQNTEYYEMVMNRSNVIVMGDALGDAAMAEGLPRCDQLIKIGFLQREVDESRSLYREKFDIVLEQDNTMNVLNALLRFIEQ